MRQHRVQSLPARAEAPEPLAARPPSPPAAPDFAAQVRAAPPLRGAGATAGAMNLAVPKPRALAPIENPLRRAKGPRAAAPVNPPSEEAILDALTALAGR